MENKTLEKTLDMAGNVAKIAANLSEVKKETPKAQPYNQSDDNSNNATTGSQSVVVAVDKGKRKEPKPVEKHVHVFPENRPLTEQECELDLKKAQMEYELKKSEQQRIAKAEDRNWEYKLQQDKKKERWATVRKVIGGFLVACGAGVVGYAVYSDYKNVKMAANPKLPEAPKADVGEGSVK